MGTIKRISYICFLLFCSLSCKKAPLVLFQGAAIDSATVALWHFDELTGDTAHDATTYHHDAKLHDCQWVKSRFGGGLHFDGKKSYAVLPNTNWLRLQDQFTIEAWLSLDTLTYVHPEENVNQGVIISNLGFFPDGGGYQMIVDNPGFRLEGRVGLGPNSIMSKYGRIHKSHTLYHLAATYERKRMNDTTFSVMKTYINGIISDSSVSRHRIHYEGTPSFFIGTNIEGAALGYSFPREFSGIIDEIKISNIAREPKDFYMPDTLTRGMTQEEGSLDEND